jgi:tripartite ATP-independent transporter DctP family solute receptor
MQRQVIRAISGCIAACALFAAPVAGIAAPAEGQVHNFILGHPTSEYVSNHVEAVCIKDLLEEKSGGRITFEIYPNSQLGKTREMVEGIISGNIDCGTIVSPLFTEFVPENAVVDMYNLFTSLESNREALSGVVLKKLQEKFAQKNMKLFGFADSGWCYLTANRPIHTLEDLSGFKIRTMENNIILAYWKSLGANPTPMDYSEIYIGLQQRTIDGQENPLDVLYFERYYEVNKYAVNIRHRTSQIPFVMNLERYNSLPEDIRAMLDEYVPQALANSRAKLDANNEQYRKELEARGVTFIDVSDDVLARIHELAAESHKLIRRIAGDEMTDLMLSEYERLKDK